jgi:hypothetical protein
MNRLQCYGCDSWFTGEGNWCPKCKLEFDEVKDNAKARTVLRIVDGGKRNGADTSTTHGNLDVATADKI